MPSIPNNSNLDPKQELNDIREELQSISFAFRDAVNNITDNLKKVNKSQGTITDSTLRNIKTISNSIDRSYSNIIGNIGRAIKGEVKREDIVNERKKLDKLRQKTISEISIIEKEIQITGGKRKKQLLDTVQILKEQIGYIENVTQLQKKELDQADLFSKKLQPIAGILKGLGKIPIIGNLLNVDRGVEKATEAAQKGKGSFSIFFEGLKGAGEGMLKIFSKFAIVTAVIEGIVKFAKFFIGSMFEADKQVTSLAKNLSISKSEAGTLKQYFSSIKNDLQTQYKLTKEIVQAQLDLSNLSNASFLYSKETIDNQIILTKELGLSSDEASNLNKLFINNNVEGKAGLDIIENQIAQYANQNGTVFSISKILKEVNKVNGQILTTFRGNTEELTKAILKVNTLGISLNQARGISNSLLDFQSSISNELEAELLTGKNLNLERARALALQGKYAEAAEDIFKQVGNYTQFSNLNVIQQQSIAKAAGMTVDELSDALYQQQFISKETKAQIERFKAARLDSYADLLKSGKLKGEELEKAQRSLTAQEKFNIALDRAKEIFSDLVTGGTLNKMVDLLTKVIDRLTSAFGIGKNFGEQGANITANILSNKGIGAKEKSIAQQISTSLQYAEKNYAPSGFSRFTYGLFGGRTGLFDANQEIGRNVLQRIQAGARITSVQDLAKIYAEEISKNAYLSNHPDRKRESIENFEKYLGVPLPATTQPKQEDFIMKGNTLVPFRKDDLIMGGTNLLGGDNREILMLLREIADGIKKSGTVLLDGQKVGTALIKGTYHSA